MSPHTRKFLASICPYPLTGVSDEQLNDVLDTWLADEFAHEDHRHVHGWTDTEETER